jgi:hypothetical protein
MEFFIPHLLEGSTSEQAWAEYLQIGQLPLDTRPVYSLTYEHEGSKYVVRVGQPRMCYAQKRGTRGDPDYQPHGSHTGTDVTAIAEEARRELFHVWSMPPYGGWANPSFVGRHSVTDIEYFEP